MICGVLDSGRFTGYLNNARASTQNGVAFGFGHGCVLILRRLRRWLRSPTAVRSDLIVPVSAAGGTVNNYNVHGAQASYGYGVAFGLIKLVLPHH